MNKLPIRTCTFHNESLTSHIQRICHLNCISPHTFWRIVTPPGKHYQQTSISHVINITPNSIVDLNLISQLTGLEISEIENLTFVPALRKWYGNDTLPEDITSQKVLINMLDANTKFCPLCLQEENYYKLVWQVKEITHCEVHGILLSKLCYSCNKPIPHLAPGSNPGVCPNCGTKLYTKNSGFIASASGYINEDWYFLLDPLQKPLTHSLLYDRKQYLALKLLYIASEKADIFSRDRALKNISNFTLNTLLQIARRTAWVDHYVHLKVILALLRKLGITLIEFSEMEVNEDFCKSILIYPKTIKDQYHCIAPWCTSFNKPGSLKRIAIPDKLQLNDDNFYYYMCCTKCGSQYGINTDTHKLHECGYLILLGWNKVKPLLEKGLNNQEISAILGEPAERILKCIIFLRPIMLSQEVKIKYPNI